MVLIEDPNPLIPHVKVVRETVSDIFGDARVKVDSTVDKWVKLERRVEREYDPPIECINREHTAYEISPTFGL